MPDPIPCPHKCGETIPTVISFEPFIGAFGQTLMRTVTSVSQDDLREHLRARHTRKGSTRSRLAR